MIEFIGWIAAVISLIGVVLNAKKNILCWPTWIISNTIWILYAYYTTQWPLFTLWLVFLFFNGYGWLQWRDAQRAS
ncbi:nicotinamide mononucleotide transporter [Acinetobacter sp.]|uniref:nicotinamide mononucleotide transporter n=1 Tax=Acinetobacter sp. TaxID=472 RepID=UPI003CFF2C32